MPRFVTTLLCLLALAPVKPSFAASNEVAAEPETVTPGQTVTLHWYFTGKKVVVTGGRFTKPTVVTGRTSLIDHPQKTTRYTFDVWYKAPVASPTTGKTTNQPIHAQYSVVVEVERTPALTSYHDPRGWQIDYPAGWHRDSVNTPDEGPGGLMYFQPEDDSLERMAIAVLRGNGLTCVELMEKVQADIPSHYEEMNIVSKDDVTFEGVPAQITVFTGRDQGHPDVLSQSMVLAFVQGDHAYVVTTRTKAASFKARRIFLEKMLKSMHFSHKPAPAGHNLTMLR